jgi:ribosomal protein S18 acetylase RimI-like enzyme
MHSFIEDGWIKKNKGSSSEKSELYEMSFLNVGHVQEMMNLQQIISLDLPLQEIFKLRDEEHLKGWFAVERSVIGVRSADGLIAYSIISIPKDARENLGTDIGLFDEELKKVGHLQAVVVHPAYRGNSLQRKMAEIHLKVLKEMSCEHVCSTVSPKNPKSLINLISMGFVIKGLVPMFDGWCRYILYKNINRPLAFNSKEIIIDGSDLEAQIKILKKGFVGYKVVLQSEGYLVYFKREKAVFYS